MSEGYRDAPQIIQDMAVQMAQGQVEGSGYTWGGLCADIFLDTGIAALQGKDGKYYAPFPEPTPEDAEDVEETYRVLREAGYTVEALDGPYADAAQPHHNQGTQWLVITKE